MNLKNFPTTLKRHIVNADIWYWRLFFSPPALLFSISISIYSQYTVNNLKWKKYAGTIQTWIFEFLFCFQMGFSGRIWARLFICSNDRSLHNWTKCFESDTILEITSLRPVCWSFFLLYCNTICDFHTNHSKLFAFWTNHYFNMIILNLFLIYCSLFLCSLLPF